MKIKKNKGGSEETWDLKGRKVEWLNFYQPVLFFLSLYTKK